MDVGEKPFRLNLGAIHEVQITVPMVLMKGIMPERAVIRCKQCFIGDISCEKAPSAEGNPNYGVRISAFFAALKLRISEELKDQRVVNLKARYGCNIDVDAPSAALIGAGINEKVGKTYSFYGNIGTRVSKVRIGEKQVDQSTWDEEITKKMAKRRSKRRKSTKP